MSNLYKNILYLCEVNGIKPGKMCNDIGISRGNITDLKNGRKTMLSTKSLNKSAEYFGVTVDFLLNGQQPAKTKKIPLLDERVIEALTDLRDNSDTRALLEVLPNMTEEQVKQMAAFARFLRRGQEDGEG